MIAVLRLLLLLAYLPLAHIALVCASPAFAALALGDLALFSTLIICNKRWLRALVALLAITVGLSWLARSPQASWLLLVLRLVPALFITGLAAWFARSLRPGREPLVTQVMLAVYGEAGAEVTPRHRDYTRTLTGVWTGSLALLAMVNVALVFVPAWSWLANPLNYVAPAMLMLGEFQLRKRLFPLRPYRGMCEFMQSVARLGPPFWRGLLR